jgi:hypothetical protein
MSTTRHQGFRFYADELLGGYLEIWKRPAELVRRFVPPALLDLLGIPPSGDE